MVQKTTYHALSMSPRRRIATYAPPRARIVDYDSSLFSLLALAADSRTNNEPFGGHSHVCPGLTRHFIVENSAPHGQVGLAHSSATVEVYSAVRRSRMSPTTYSASDATPPTRPEMRRRSQVSPTQ